MKSRRFIAKEDVEEIKDVYVDIFSHRMIFLVKLKSGETLRFDGFAETMSEVP